ncbi:MAG: hypothetical protein ACRDNB_09975 [Gaiellaceae bacterium]
MKKLIPALALACALISTSTAAAVDFGANDDTGKYAADGGATFFAQMKASGLSQNVMTIRWTPGTTEIPDKLFLDKAVPAAVAAGIKPIFAVYPYPPSAIESGAADPAAFGSWVRSVADAYPAVTSFIVGNEPNLNTFWRAQGDGTGKVLSGASFGPFLAAGYDALKAKSSGITVLGVGSSPRGERAPQAAGKSSPVHFLGSLGDWYRASGRPAPLMDGFSYHPYPNPSDFSVPFGFTYGWPNAGVQELFRVKQALWDAFAGTPQPTTLRGLKLYLDEVGWQVDTTGSGAYEGTENVRVTSEETQAAIYAEMVRFVSCDPDVAQLNFFGYYDERNRAGWQSALRRADGSERAANATVASAIAAGCTTGTRSWTPLAKPEGAAVEFGAIGAKAKGKKLVVRYTPTAGEDVTVKAGFVPASTPKAKIPGLLAAAGRVDANRRPPRTATATVTTAPQVLAVVLSAALNPDRAAVFTSPAVRSVAAPAAKSKAKTKAKAKAKPRAKAGKKLTKKPVKKSAKKVKRS